MKKISFTIIAMLFAVATFAGDVLTINNGKAFEGEVTKINKSSVVFMADGNKYVIPSVRIFSIKFEDTKDKTYTRFMKKAAGTARKGFRGVCCSDCEMNKDDQLAVAYLFRATVKMSKELVDSLQNKQKVQDKMSQNKFNDLKYLGAYKKERMGQSIAKKALGSL